jgi:hypothetical protein
MRRDRGSIAGGGGLAKGGRLAACYDVVTTQHQQHNREAPMKRWQHPTRIGMADIIERETGYSVYLDGDLLGKNYRTPQQALDDFAGGHTDWPSCGTDPSTLDISDDLGDWSLIRR